MRKPATRIEAIQYFLGPIIETRDSIRAAGYDSEGFISGAIAAFYKMGLTPEEVNTAIKTAPLLSFKDKTNG